MPNVTRCPPQVVDPDARRGVIAGLSLKAAARQTAWLHSVDAEQLTGHGYAITTTLRDRPADHTEWGRFRKAYSQALKRLGAIRAHWAVEKHQDAKGGVPHQHLAVYFDHELSPRELFELRDVWCRIAAGCGAMVRAQHVDRIRPGRGWDRYCAKHAARTARHAQRDHLMFPGWESAGRLWGHWGEWPTRIDRWLLNPQAVVEMRRLLRSYLVADARVSADKLARFHGGPARVTETFRTVGGVCTRERLPKGAGRRRVRSARHLLDADPVLWSLRGLRAWIPEADMGRLMVLVAGMPRCVVDEIVSDRGGGEWWRRLDEGRRRARARLGLPEPERPTGGAYVLRPLVAGGLVAAGPLTPRQARIAELRARRGVSDA